MKITLLAQAEDDLVDGFHFYEAQENGLGAYFLSSLYSDIESLRLYAGIHPVRYRHLRRLLAKRFPFAIFYMVHEDAAFVHAVLDCRKDPAWTRRRLDDG